MRKKGLIVVSALLITVVSIGSYGFAQGSDQELINNQSEVKMTRSLETEDHNIQSEIATRESVRPGNYNSHCWNDEDMIQTMNENGYENMSGIMNSVGREDMERMHNSMMGGRRNRFGGRNMMGRFQ